MSKAAIFQRVQKSAEWLEWLTVNFCRERRILTACPDWLEAYRVMIADATKVTGKATYTLHMILELFSLRVAEQILTDGTRGESMKNFQSIREKNLILADRVYGTVTGMRWLEERDEFARRNHARTDSGALSYALAD